MLLLRKTLKHAKNIRLFYKKKLFACDLNNKNHFVPNKTEDTLYVFFPHFRPCDVTQEKSFFQILSHPREHECGMIYENPLRPGSDLNGENKPAEKVYTKPFIRRQLLTIK